MTSDGYAANTLNQSQINNEASLFPDLGTNTNPSTNQSGHIEIVRGRSGEHHNNSTTNPTINFSSISRIDSNQLVQMEEYENSTSTCAESKIFIGNQLTSQQPLISAIHANRYNF